MDDEKDILDFLEYTLKREGFNVLTAVNGTEALSLLAENPDIILLDIMMPGMDGLELCRRIRLMDEFKEIPIIFLTARGGEFNEITGLEHGANDYIQKPVSAGIIIARIKANLRNTSNIDRAGNKIKIGVLQIDKERYEVKINGRVVVFPRKEFEILYFLANHQGKVFSRNMLLKDVWGADISVVGRTVDVHIRKIREKLEEHADMIETVKGVGYRFTKKV